ncbi:MAG: glutamate--tRNA ligase [Acidimicrobiia bacterium]
MTTAASPRVRFAPAPTGFLHLGSARTALFNWLFARRHGGSFLLRIEDTDAQRSRPEWEEAIGRALGWLGLDWDEGPYRQSDRLPRYREAADRLLETGAAYECFCTEEELQAANRARLAAGGDPGYDGRCRDRSAGERAALASSGRPRSVRFRTPDEGASEFDDLVRGKVAVDWGSISDFVIVRSDGAPVFFLANAVDDAEMGITHVVRGEDLLDSTHRVLALRRALGVPGQLVYAHLSLLVGADRAKLSKRHGAIALEDFASRGYLPEALFNYLALLGFSPPGEREVLDREELAEVFDLSRVTRAAAFFDHGKLDWMNGEHLRRLEGREIAERAMPFARGLYGDRLDEEVFAAGAVLARERSTTLVEVAESTGFLFVPEESFTIAPEALERLRAVDRVGEVLDAARAHLASCPWDDAEVDLRPVLEGLGIKARRALPAVYAAVEGFHVGLPLFASICLLGRERVLRRLEAARRLVP